MIDEKYFINLENYRSLDYITIIYNNYINQGY
jgi:hypothetical protein